MVLKWIPLQVRLDGQPARLEQNIKPDSVIEYSLTSDRPLLKDIINLNPVTIKVTVNNRPLTLTASNCTICMNGKPAAKDEPIINGARLEVDWGQTGCILSDVFRVLDFTPTGQTSRLILEVDGQPAGYITPIHDGSQMKICWE
jgi:hypothetical protein